MSNDRKNPREEKTAVDDISRQPSQRRRRLVKGALSAPVFLTLQNGSVFANTSNDATVVVPEDPNDLAGLKCAFPLDPSYPRTDGEKLDFGPSSMCSEDGALDGAFLTDELPGRCNVEPTNPTTQAGYIVSGSSGGSICV